MTGEIGKIGGSNYSYAGYSLSRQGNEAPKDPVAEPAVNNYNETQVDPAKVMDFMAANNIFVPTTETTKVGDVDAATQERVANYMEQFETYYALIAQEFGEENAPLVMDLVMDKLMGMVA